MANHPSRSCFWKDRNLVKQWKPGKGKTLHIIHIHEPNTCTFNKRISLPAHIGNMVKDDSPIYLNVPNALGIKGYGIDNDKKNKKTKEKKKEMIKKKEKENLLAKKKHIVDFVPFLARKSARLNNQNNALTTSDKGIVLNFLGKLSERYCCAKSGLNMKLIIKQFNDKFNWIPIFEEDDSVKKYVIFYKHSIKMTTKQIPWFEVKESQLKDAGWGLYALQDFDKFDCIGIYSGFKSINYVSNTSNTFAIFERVK